MADETPQPGRDHRGWFVPGNQIGAAQGRPRGSRNQASILLDQIGEENGQDVLKRVVQDALAGDVRCADIILSRVWPARKGRPITLPLPAIHTAADVVTALATVTTGLANAEISPEEAAAVAAVLETHRRAIETADLARRIEALEGSTAPEDGE